MNFEKYVPLAMRTVNQDIEKADRMINACLGLAGEYSEFDEATSIEHKLEELGDIYWYVALFADSLDYEEYVLIEEIENPSTLKMVGYICDTIKKNVYQGHPLSYDVTDILIAKLLRALERECVKLKTTPSNIMEANVAKLEARYPSGFEVDKSVNREQ